MTSLRQAQTTYNLAYLLEAANTRGEVPIFARTQLQRAAVWAGRLIVLWVTPMLSLIVGASVGTDYGEAQVRLDNRERSAATAFIHFGTGQVVEALTFGLLVLVTFFAITGVDWSYRVLRAAAEQEHLRLAPNVRLSRWPQNAVLAGLGATALGSGALFLLSRAW